MFPDAPSLLSSPRRALRSRLVRGLDVAVEFATLGEYGVDEVANEPAQPPACGWDWPPRCSARPRPAAAAAGSRRMRPGAAASCA